MSKDEDHSGSESGPPRPKPAGLLEWLSTREPFPADDNPFADGDPFDVDDPPAEPVTCFDDWVDDDTHPPLIPTKVGTHRADGIGARAGRKRASLKLTMGPDFRRDERKF